MKVFSSSNFIPKTPSDLYIVSLFKGQKTEEVKHGTSQVDNALGGLVSDVIKEESNAKTFKGDPGETTTTRTSSKHTAKKITIVGLGDKTDFNLNSLRKAISNSTTAAVHTKAGRLNTILHGLDSGKLTSEEIAREIAALSLLTTYVFNAYKSKKEEHIPNSLTVTYPEKKKSLVEKGIKRGVIEADAKNFVRDLVNTPASDKPPKVLAHTAKLLAKEHGLHIEIFNAEKCKKLGMNGVLSVGRGSANPPFFIVLKYKPKNPEKHVALVGKGVIFDSGGLDMKSADGMLDMKIDMAGGATVLGVMKAISQLKPNVEVTGIVPVVENMTGGDAYKPRDIIKMMNGKTVEVLNTDAEGRLILADALAYATTLKPDEIIDLATLTGAIEVALGDDYTGVMANEAGQNLAEKIIKAGEYTGEEMWQLPVSGEVKDAVKGKTSDLKNLGIKGHAGAQAGAALLEHFVGKTPWVHLDIAGTAWDDTEAMATGVPLRAITSYLVDP